MLKLRKIIYNITDQINVLYNLRLKMKRNFRKSLLLISDNTFAVYRHYKMTRRVLNLKDPKTFNEKLWWLKLNNKDPLMTICSDKVKVREYVMKCGLGHILNDFYGIYNYACEIDFEELPANAFIKTNHGSGTNRLWDSTKPFNMKKFKAEFNNALKYNYYLESREWNYKNINPKIITEKILVDSENKSLVDYRFLCFDGKVKTIFVDIETVAEDGTHSPDAKRNVYNPNFEYQDIKVKREQFDPKLITKPINFEKMIEYAETLSKPFPFCRVDLYNIQGKIIFGEITFYPGGANQIIEPEKMENLFGNWIDLNNKKIVL